VPASDSADDPWLWAYLAVLATIVPAGTYGWWRLSMHPDLRPPAPTPLNGRRQVSVSPNRSTT